MSSPNFVMIEGYVARGAELREVGNRGQSVLSFSLAVSNGRNKDGESLGSSYFDIEFWNPAEKVSDSIVDASEDEDSSLKMQVRGRLKQDRWENEDGDTRTRVKIAATTVSIPNYSENQNDDNSGGGSKRGGSSKRRGSSSKKKTSKRGGKSSGSSRSSGGNSKKRSRKTAEEDTGRDDDDFDDGDDDDDDDVPF